MFMTSINLHPQDSDMNMREFQLWKQKGTGGPKHLEAKNSAP